ncbi:NADH-quinone oxidoreductase subunit L [Paraliomyxa miuraensis]|uniref:NADH-quinone oxidoreductase subunit L n=1 Tax=Paraliomyxa miuraensis TaxID=376150 RepID=UPI002251124E|nr:NADH-quinone oxidoreductase subunit L [Paraliomyxa miuraensis]MCX4243160.1 NADH-quinone oxidoreductase subunit L [Paraliomyxa miuraensis]
MNETEFNLHFIPLFPLLGAVFNLLLGKQLLRSLGDRLGREVVHLVAIGAIAFSCFFTISAVFEVMVGQDYDRLVDSVYPWIVSGDLHIGFDLVLDHLSAVMCLVITGVGLLIHIFSVGYMAKDPDYGRYFAYLNLFCAAMLILVLGKSLVLTFVGWEGVGVCSYLLIGFWFTDDAKATAGRKAFIMNRVGDFGFILGMLLIYTVVGSLDVDAIARACALGEQSPLVQKLIFGVPIATVATMLLFVGCTGKSAQIPLFTWLPDAMAGPTPVSALIHAATMVTAGVYLIVRLNFLFALAPVTMAVIAVIGAATALFAATIGITQNDIKKVLAYSTVSQLGYMFLAAGMGAWVAAIFHLVTHAFFKACLFLGSGAVIEACHHNQDIRTMGGLREKMPVTAGTFFVSCLAIAGIFPFAGFFSKDEILLHAYANESRGIFTPGGMELNYILYSLGALAALCTSFYMFRLYYLTFEGKFRGDHHTWHHYVREHWIMSLPLVILAGFAAIGGLLGWPHVFGGVIHIDHVLEQWLEPITSLSGTYGGEYTVGVREQFLHEGHVGSGMELTGMAIGLGIGIAGWVFARRLYLDGPSEQAAMLAKRFSALHAASSAKYWVDEIYDVLFVKPVRMIGQLCHQVGDMLLIDGVGVQGTAGAVGVLGTLTKAWHNGNVRRYLASLTFGVAILLGVIYLNPQVSRGDILPKNAAGERELAPDIGLRRTFGAQSVNMDLFWGLFKIHLPGKAEQDAAARRGPPGGEIIRAPALEPAKNPDGRPLNGGAGGQP